MLVKSKLFVSLFSNLNTIMTRIILFIAFLFASCGNTKTEDLRRLRFELAQVESSLSETRYSQMENISLYETLLGEPDEDDLLESVKENIILLSSLEVNLLNKKDSLEYRIDELLGYVPELGVDTTREYFFEDTEIEDNKIAM